MSFTRTAAFAIAVAFAFCVPAQAAPKLMDAISAQDLAAMFNAHKIPAKARLGDDGMPIVDMDIVIHHKDHLPTQALLHDCHGHGLASKCRIVIYFSYWGLVRPIPLAKINAYNSEYYLGKVALRPKHAKGPKKWALVVTDQVSLAGGVTADHLGASLYEWVRSAEHVADKLKPKSYQK